MANPTSGSSARAGTSYAKLTAAAIIAVFVLFVAGRDPRPASALFHIAVINEIQFGRGGDPDLQFVEIKMLTGGQNVVKSSRLSAWNADGSFFGVLLTVPANVPSGTANGHWIMASTGFAAASGMTPDFTFAPVTLPATGMLCWGAPGVIPPDPPTWDATLPTNYVDCVPYGGYTNANIRFGPASPFGLGDGTNSLFRFTDTDNASVDFALVCPNPRNNVGAYGYNRDEDFIDLPPSKAFDDFTWPFSDRISDACETDDDNDALTDVDELGLPSGVCPSAAAPTDPNVRDSDGDRTLDGAECLLGTDPNNAASFPGTILPDTDGDRLPDVFEAAFGATVGMPDSDGDKLLDGVEVRYYNSSPSNTNSDGDGCGDAREVASINADLTVSAVDLSQIAQAFGPVAGPNYIAAFDPNKEGGISAIDLSFVASRFGACP